MCCEIPRALSTCRWPQCCRGSFSLVAEGRKYVGGFFYRRHVGRLWQRPHLLANSPRPHADKVQVPVLLAVSEKNRIVNPRQTRRLYKALQKAKKDVELVELPGGDHALSRQDNRKAFPKPCCRSCRST